MIEFSKNLALPLCLIFVFPALAQEPSAEFIMNGFKDSRQRLRTGHYSCECDYATESAKGAKSNTHLTLSAWFDYDTDSFRYDQTGSPPGRRLSRQNRPGFDRAGGKYIKKPTQSILWQTGDNFVKVDGSKIDYSSVIMVLDTRSVGLCSYLNYRNPIGFNELFEGCLSRMRRDKVSVRRVGSKLLRIDQPIAGGRLQIDFDESRGYLPISLTAFNTTKQRGKLQNEQRETIVESAQVEWTKINEVWIPKSVIAISGAKPQSVFRAELRFEWQQVNQTIEPAVFTTRGLGLPDGTLIGDARNGGERPVMLGAIGDMTPNPRLALIEPPAPRPWWQGWPTYAAAVAVFIAIGVGVRFWLRCRKVPV